LTGCFQELSLKPGDYHRVFVRAISAGASQRQSPKDSRSYVPRTTASTRSGSELSCPQARRELNSRFDGVTRTGHGTRELHANSAVDPRRHRRNRSESVAIDSLAIIPRPANFALAGRRLGAREVEAVEGRSTRSFAECDPRTERRMVEFDSKNAVRQKPQRICHIVRSFHDNE